MTEAPDGGMREELALIAEAAREGGRIAMGYFRKDPEVWMKLGDSPVSEADFAVDRFLRERLTAARPDYGWLSEETADTPGRLAARRTFVVDPIDGTRAFLDGRPTWCVSVAVVEDGRAVAGVLDCPALSEFYEGIAGSGAFRNGERLRIGPAGPEPLVGGPKALIGRLPEEVRRTFRSVAYVPSLAYRLAMVAGGAMDATFVKPNAHDWDLAAAGLLLTEAGGRLLNEHGAQPRLAGTNPRHGVLVAGSGALLDMLLPAVEAH